MKTLKYLTVCVLMSASFSFAQNAVSVVGAPAWGVPVTTQRYYYIPDIETYYDIPSREYISLHDGIWVRSATVPVIYKNYDFHRGRKIIINDYRGNAPYAFYNVHRVKYVPAPYRVYAKEKHFHKNKNKSNHVRGHGRYRN